MILLGVASVFPYIIKIFGLTSVTFCYTDAAIIPFLFKYKLLQLEGKTKLSKLILALVILFIMFGFLGLYQFWKTLM